MARHFVTREACPGCAGSVATTIYSRAYSDPIVRRYLDVFYGAQGGVEHEYLADARFVLRRCATCGLVYQQEVPDAFLLQKLYDEWIDPGKALALHEYADVEKTMRLVANLGDHLRHLSRAPRHVRALDFGMGYGQWCALARGFGCHVTGVELSQARVDHARTMGIPSVALDELATASCDLINVEQVLEHLSDPRATLSRLAEVLSPDGLLYVAVPDGWDIARRLRRPRWDAPKSSRWLSLNAVAPLEHLNCFDHQSLLRIGADAGLVPAAVPRTYAFSGRDRVKSSAKPLYHRARGKRGTSLTFQRAS